MTLHKVYYCYYWMLIQCSVCAVNGLDTNGTVKHGWQPIKWSSMALFAWEVID